MNGLLKSQLASHLAPKRVEIWPCPHTAATTACAKPPRVSCCFGTDVWRDQGATASGAENDIAHMPLWVRKGRNIEGRASN